jgi:hypothetical protein
MRKLYRSPSLVAYGTLSEMTAGSGGHSPDSGFFVNNDCLTGITTGTASDGHTGFFQFGCTGTPIELLGSF